VTLIRFILCDTCQQLDRYVGGSQCGGGFGPATTAASDPTKTCLASLFRVTGGGGPGPMAPPFATARLFGCFRGCNIPSVPT